MLFYATQGKVICDTASGARMGLLQERVKQLREKMGWAQEDLAREIGVSLSTIQRWEKNCNKPTRLPRRELIKLLQGAGIDNGQL